MAANLALLSIAGGPNLNQYISNQFPRLVSFAFLFYINYTVIISSLVNIISTVIIVNVIVTVILVVNILRNKN